MHSDCSDDCSFNGSGRATPCPQDSVDYTCDLLVNIEKAQDRNCRKIKEQNDMIARMLKQLEHKVRAIKSMEGRVHKCEAKLHEYRNRNGCLEEECRRLAEERACLKEKLRVALMQLSIRQETSAADSDLRAMVEIFIAELGDVKRKSIRDKDQAILETKSLQQRMNEKEDEIRNAKCCFSRCEAELNAARNKCNCCEAELGAVKAALEQEHAQRASLERALHHAQSELERERHGAKDMHDRLHDCEGHLRSTQQEIACSKAEGMRLRCQIQECEELRKRIQAKNERDRKDSDDSYQAEIEGVRLEGERRNKELQDQLDLYAADVSNRQTAVGRLEDDHRFLQQKVVQLDQRLRDAECRCCEMEDEIQRHQVELQRALEECSRLHDDRERVANLLASTRRRCSELEGKIDVWKARHEQLQLQNDKLISKNKSLMLKLTRMPPPSDDQPVYYRLRVPVPTDADDMHLRLRVKDGNSL